MQQRGIQDTTGAVYARGAHGQITHVDCTGPPLVEPGNTAQAVGLFDAVGTGYPKRKEDRRLPPSMISGFQITADDERRGLFKSNHIIDPGMTPAGRFLAVTVAGAHSDIGGSYHRDGLAIRNGNLMIDYLDTRSDLPFLARSVEPDDPRLNVVHRSEDGMLIYRLGHKIDRLSPDGYNELLVPKREMKHVPDPFNAEPRDESLNSYFERQPVKSGAPPPAQEQQKDTPANDFSARLDRVLAAGQANDWQTFRMENPVLANGDAVAT